MPTIGAVLENNISHNNKTKYQFSCLTAVQHWYDGSTTGQNENYGIMLQYADNTIADYNSFYSADCTDATMRPSMTISYTPFSTSRSVIEGGTLPLSVSGAPGVVTWNSDNPSVATVNSNGVVTGIKAGKAVITAFIDGNEYKEFTVYVTLSDGFYYIERGSSRLYVGTEGSIAEHKYVRLTTSTTLQEQQIHQMWHISHLSNGFYCIRPLYKPDMALRSENGLPGYVEIATIGINNTATGVPLSSKWTIEFTGTGYAFYYAGATSMAMRSDGGYPLASITTDDYLPGDLAFSWNVTEVEQEISGIYLLNTYTNNIVSERIKKYVIANEPTSLGSLNLRAISYSTNVIQNSTEAICPDVIWSVEDPSIVSINGATGAITGIKTGSTTVVGTLEEDSTQKVMFDIVVIGPEQYAAGVRLTTIGDTQYYDYTIAINALFEEAVELCGENRCMTWEEYCTRVLAENLLAIPNPVDYQAEKLKSFTWFYSKVNHGEEWDIKLQECWEAAMPNVPYLGMHTDFFFRGEKRTAEKLGNIMYGYTGRATGFGEITLYWGGGVANKGSLTHEDLVKPPNYGDNKNDHDMIEYGYDLFLSDYPSYPPVGYNGIPTEEVDVKVLEVIMGILL